MKSTAPRRQKRRKPISASLLQQLAEGTVRSVSGSGVRAGTQNGSLTVSVDRKIPRAPFRLMAIQSISNDYLTCKRLYRGATTGGNVMVLKPYELLHDVVYYPQLTVFTTVDAQTATATDGTTTETWAVTPDYAVGQIILVYRLFTDYVDAGSAVAIEWVDLNISGRAWAVA